MNEHLKKLLKEAMENPDILNDDDFLEEEDKIVKQPTERKINKKKCANCTCELRDKKEEVKSACGGCYKGDAFRCSGCPYLGMPAFNEGDVIKFD
ncbi:anamorsin (DRE2) [Vairimorpha necatrix]|uniref:Anamorsin (DRE2) n=1 Tax=Vairimorpha necatrix TaxID=6039 RepID=A0AAX4JCQ8_9MICR